jgi:DNA-directed RNA polymerase subunit RPC12/RpoP
MEATVYQCTNCGGNLEFHPGEQSLVCPFCGTKNDAPVDTAPTVIDELDYEAAVRDLESSTATIEVTAATCEGCGATITLQENATTGSCYYCGTQVVGSGAAHKALQPQYIMPFRLTRDVATERFRTWIRSRWFAPSALKRYARVTDPIQGVYYPFWTFDAHTRSDYTGQRGDYYTEQIRTTDSEGKTVTRTVTKTRWTPARGTVSRTFDDVLVAASESLEPQLVDRLDTYSLKEVVPYSDRFLSGFRGESYSVELSDGFERAKGVMDGVIRTDVHRDIGGDTQRIHTLHTLYSGVTFKYVVLPVYALKYRFKKKLFPVVINGETGEIEGKRPYSWIKIAALVLAIGGVLVGGYFLLKYFGVI